MYNCRYMNYKKVLSFLVLFKFVLMQKGTSTETFPLHNYQDVCRMLWFPSYFSWDAGGSPDQDANWYTEILISVNIFRSKQSRRHFADDSFRYIFFNEIVWILIKISLKFIANGPIDDILAMVQIMAWRRPGNKPLSEPVMVRLLTHICVARPQRVNGNTLALLPLVCSFSYL